MGAAVPRRPRVDAVRDTLLSQIGKGRFAEGRQLPPEPELATRLGVSRATLREALRSLEEGGILTRTRGAGTFVVDRARVKNNLAVNFGVTEAIRSAGMRPGFEDAHVRRQPAGPTEGARLALDPAEEVVVVDRVRTADGRPVVFTVDVLPGSLVPDGPSLDRRLTRGSLYEILEERFGVVIHHGVASFAPSRAPGRVAEKLRVPKGTLVLYLHQIDYDETGRPVLSSHEHHLADAFEFSVIRRGPGRRTA